jgi:NhaP-type Na+/H+ or K+/H+ antiporter
MYFYLGYNLIASLILGVISSGTTTITITALLEKLSAPKPVKDVLLLESVVNDLTVIIATFIILDFIQAGSVDFAGAIRTVVGDVLSAIVTGFFAAIIWQRVLVGLHVKRELSYMSTLGAALITYYAGFLFGANPIVTVFVFGLSLANLKYLSEFLQMGDFLTSLRSIRTVQQDITFFVRTFFFVILGIIFNPLSLSLPVVTVVGLITMLVLLARLLSSSIMAMADPLFAENRFLISVMIPRGFTATILAFIPAQYGFEIPFLSDIVLLLVFSTTLFAIVGTTFVSGAYAQEKAQNEKKKGKNG